MGPSESARRKRMLQRLPSGPTVGLTATLAAALVAKVEEEGFFEQAASLCRVAKSTLWDWLAKGQMDTEDPIYGVFYLDMYEARAKFVSKSLKAVQSAAARNPMAWAGQATIVERLMPEMFGRPDQKVQIKSEVNTHHHTSVSLDGLTLEELIQLDSLLQKGEKPMKDLPSGSYRQLP